MNLIDNDFVISGKLYDFLNDLARVHDREIKRKCEIKNDCAYRKEEKYGKK